MKIAIHQWKGSFSDRWIAYCEKHQIEYKIVNAYDNDIIQQLSDCDAFLWHHGHGIYQDVLFAKQLLYSLQTVGIKVFPDFYTCWHFDDKVGQKYLLEAVNAPFVPSYIFYSKADAYKWIENATFPKVFKLRSGAGSSNVKLVKNKREAYKFVNKAFGKGFPPYDRMHSLKDRIKKWRGGKDSFEGVCKSFYRLLFPPKFTKMLATEKGYVYFQDFIKNDGYDIRVIVIGNKAFAIKRIVRKNDFRASGSGDIHYRMEDIPTQCVSLSFEVAKKIKAQCIGFDYVIDLNGNAFIVEISYGFVVHGYDSCPGYWTDDLTWHQGSFNPQEWMMEDLIGQLESYKPV